MAARSDIAGAVPCGYRGPMPESAEAREPAAQEVHREAVPAPAAEASVDATAIGSGGSPAVDRVLALQRGAGNQAVARYLAAQRSGGATLAVSPDPSRAWSTPPGGVLLRQPEGGDSAAANPLAVAAQNNAHLIRNRANMRLGSLGNFNSTVDRAFNVWQPKRDRLVENYRIAFHDHERVLAAGRAAAESQNFYTGILIGAAASVVIAAGVAIALPAVAAAPAFSGVWWASTAGQAVASSAGGSAAGTVVNTDTSGYQAQGSAQDEEISALREINALERRARRMGQLGVNFGIFASNAEYAVAQIDALQRHGEADMNMDETLTLISELMNQEHDVAETDRVLANEQAGFERLQAAAQTWQVPPTSRVEQDIWILWISRVTDGDILDRDAIENHLHSIGVLGENSRLGVDFGYWTSGDDEQEAIAAARTSRQELEAQRAAQPTTE
jgi:hypothetical protein